MKNIFPITGLILFVANGLFGLLLSGYDNFNLAITSVVIAITTMLLYLTTVIKIKDGYIIGLSFLLALFGIVEYVLGLVSPQEMQNNGYIIASIVLLTIEVIALIICNIISKSIK